MAERNSVLSLELHTLKLLILGDQAVGKTSLLLRYTKDTFFDKVTSTLGVDFKQKEIQRGHMSFIVQIWDSAGQERFRSVTKTYYKRASGIVIAYDSNNFQSFTNVKVWVQQILSEVGAGVPIVLAATKYDNCEHQVKEQQEKELEKELGLKIFHTSSKTGEGIYEMFDFIVDKCILAKGFSCRTGSVVTYAVQKKKCCRAG